MGMCSLIRKDVINTLDTWLARATAPDDVHANAFSLAAPVENSSFKNGVMDVFLKNWRFQLVVYTCFKTSPHPTQLLRRMVQSRFTVKLQKYPVDQIFTWLSIHPSVEQIMSEFSFPGELILLIHLIAQCPNSSPPLHLKWKGGFVLFNKQKGASHVVNIHGSTTETTVLPLLSCDSNTVSS